MSDHIVTYFRVDFLKIALHEMSHVSIAAPGNWRGQLLACSRLLESCVSLYRLWMA